MKFSISSGETSAMNPSAPRLTPSTGICLFPSRRIVFRNVPSPPREIRMLMFETRFLNGFVLTGFLPFEINSERFESTEK